MIRTLGRLMIATIVLVLATSAAVANDATFERIVKVQIGAQSLSTALIEFSRQARVQVITPADKVGNFATQGVSGEMSIGDALAKLLEGTPLGFHSAGANTVGLNVKDVTVQRTGSRQDSGKIRMAQADAASGKQADDSRMVEEIVVTATRREQNIRDVPISITAIGFDDIDRRGLVSSQDYLRSIPGVNQVEGATGQSIVIRGVETSPRDQNYASGATTATYFGETPTTNSAGLAGDTSVDLKLVDIQRVEVLRGPQGTAFGSSSMGGAVRTIPVAPKLDRFEGKVAIGFSSTADTGGDNYNVQAVGNIPLIQDRLAIRVVGYQYEDTGYYRNRAGSNAAFQTAVAGYGAQASGIDDDEVGSYSAKGGRIAALFQASDDLKFTLSYLSQKTETDGAAVSTSGVYEQSMLQVAPEHVARGQSEGFTDTDIDIANVVMDYNFGWANLVATYSNTQSGSATAVPYQLFGQTWPLSFNPVGDHREQVGEVRLATQLDGAWNFLAGVYAEELKDDAHINYV